MFIATISGYIGALDQTVTQSGKQMMKMRIGVKVRQKDETGQWGDATEWCEVVAFDDAIQRWHMFKVGDAVELTGRPNFHTYMKRDGTIGKTIEFSGIEGGMPSIRFAPGGGRGNGDEGNAPQSGNRGGRYERPAPAQELRDIEDVNF